MKNNINTYKYYLNNYMLALYCFPSEKQSEICISEDLQMKFMALGNHYICCAGFDYTNGSFRLENYLPIIKIISEIGEEDFQQNISLTHIFHIHKKLCELFYICSEEPWKTYYTKKYMNKTTNYIIHLSNHYNGEEKILQEYAISIMELDFLCKLFAIYLEYNVNIFCIQCIF